MARLRRRWRVVKWAGLILSVLTAAVWAVSLKWALEYNTARITHSVGPSGQFYYRRSFVVSMGGLHAINDASVPRPLGWTTGTPWTSVPWWLPCVERNYWGTGWDWSLPLWVPLLTFATPAALLWRRDRRRIPPGHCLNCGYNLTGNVSGVCPECGEKT